MTKQQVQALLGTPSIADPFHHDRWDYVASERTQSHRPRRGQGPDAVVRRRHVDKVGRPVLSRSRTKPLVKRMDRFGNLPKEKDKKKHQ